MGGRSSRPVPVPSVAPSVAPAPVPNAAPDPLPRMREGSHFKLILVRHGISCANLKKARGDLFASSYMDPELTRLGQIKAKNRGDAFRDALKRRGMAYPIVMASMLMRAQQTAFLMMDMPMTEIVIQNLLSNWPITAPPKIYIAPYVSELGSRFWFKTADNIPYRPSEQLRIMELEGKTPFLNEYGQDSRERIESKRHPFPQDAIEPSPARFIDWLTTFIEYMNENYPKYIYLHADIPISENMALRNAESALERIQAMHPGESLPSYALPHLETKIARQKYKAETRERLKRPVVLFTHGNYILEFIKYVLSKSRIPSYERPRIPSKKGDDLLNYNAFEFNATMIDGKLHFEYIGPFMYAPFDSPEYTESAYLNKDTECEYGDGCIKPVCPGTRKRRLPLEKAKREQSMLQNEESRSRKAEERERKKTERIERNAAIAMEQFRQREGIQREESAAMAARLAESSAARVAAVRGNAGRPGRVEIEPANAGVATRRQSSATEGTEYSVNSTGGRRSTRRIRKCKRKTHRRRR